MIHYFLCGSGEWGTVCNNGWSYYESLAICHRLGYSSAEENGAGDSVESRQGRVLIQDVDCAVGSKWDDCSVQFVGRGVQNCSHGIQAEVACGK